MIKNRTLKIQVTRHLYIKKLFINKHTKKNFNTSEVHSKSYLQKTLVIRIYPFTRNN